MCEEDNQRRISAGLLTPEKEEATSRQGDQEEKKA
jgi:hypothetical protein